MSRLCRLVSAAPIALAVAVAPAATAVVPPVVDNGLLPPPAPPSPTHQTEQREPCFSPQTHTDAGDAHKMDDVWRLARGAGQTVAVIDTGVTRHRLLPHLVGGGDYVSRGDGTLDCDGHGTIVAGIIGGAANTTGFSGVAPEATILSIRQSSNKFRAAGGALGVGDVETMAEAVRTAADLGATVINISTVACVAVADRLDDRALGAALAYAVDVKNVVVVTAAGNVGGAGHCPEQNPASGPAGRPNWEDVRSVASPAWYDDLVLCVGSVGSDGRPSEFSLGGPWVDVAAPGEGIVSLHPDGEGLIDTLADGSPISGTSYAAPTIAGIAALVRSRFPQLSAREVMRRITSTAHRPPGDWDPFVGNGVVDALAALSAGPGVPAVPTRTVPTVAARPPVFADPQPRRVAFGGAAVCVAAAVLSALILSSRRLRRRIPDD
ncbi:type VII secretion-associated serine protease mycosin [Mycobacterium sp. 21AC1]|uniref:type VII secretion-associated serine protease mycosin n=1 Tax=[Mycobacterium] appelbergii TaxID=2939269 RepID=UPI00293932D2|nr:type VII secretion-associated serine protease mycosin [Mycobacterium sp. 21AC1]MDV3127477.1 type VII secretion-associated serine protease mycosin [Mycobacterium sp. 21AC1]